jgi:hypothetical protein
MFKEVTYSSEIRKDADLFARIQRATNAYSQRVGDLSSQVAIHWDRLKAGDGSDVFRVTLIGWTNEVSADLQSDELVSAERIRRRLSRTYDRLLSARGRVLQQEFEEMLGAGQPG